MEACHPGLKTQVRRQRRYLKQITQKDLARRYGYFLYSLDRSGKLDLDAPAGFQRHPLTLMHTSLGSRNASVRSRFRAQFINCAYSRN